MEVGINVRIIIQWKLIIKSAINIGINIREQFIPEMALRRLAYTCKAGLPKYFRLPYLGGFETAETDHLIRCITS